MLTSPNHAAVFLATVYWRERRESTKIQQVCFTTYRERAARSRPERGIAIVHRLLRCYCAFTVMSLNLCVHCRWMGKRTRRTACGAEYSCTEYLNLLNICSSLAQHNTPSHSDIGSSLGFSILLEPATLWSLDDPTPPSAPQMIRLEEVALWLLLSILYIPLLLFTAAATSGTLFIFLLPLHRLVLLQGARTAGHDSSPPKVKPHRSRLLV